MMSQRLNSVMLLHVHNKLTDTVDMKVIVNDFVKSSKYTSLN